MKPLNDFFKKWQKKDGPLKRFASFVLNKFKKDDGLLKQYKEIWAGLGLLLILGIIIFIVVSGTVKKISDSPNTEKAVEEVKKQVSEARNPLTGAILDNELKTNPQVFGVMVENSAQAWPLVGLDSAFLVIEAPVEGSIPRFISFFSEDIEFDKLGPVRSARPYFLDWNDEFGAVYAHVGGSFEALDLIKYKYDTNDLNQFWQSEYFWRQNNNGRFAPHNVYTSSERLVASLNELKLSEPKYSAWMFKNDSPVAEDVQQSLRVDFTKGTTYDVDWKYDQKKNQYNRYQGKNLMKMEDGGLISANNVVVISTDIKTIDSVGRKSIVTVGEGDALLAQDGDIRYVRWRKTGRTERLKFFEQNGDEVKMNAGKTWIEIVSTLNQSRPYSTSK